MRLAALLALLALPAFADPSLWQREWPRTDFSQTSVDFAEILSGGPPKDGIPAVHDPAMIPVAEETRIGAREPVITLELEGETPRAYPVRYLMWHEIANDEVGGVPVAATFCPLCNSGIVFDRRVEGRTLSFGVSGKLRHSDMVMYDRETESWWQQAIGEGIVGEMTGVELTPLPSWMESWEEFRARNPEGLVMDEPRMPRGYGANPYVGYDSATRPFLYRGEMPPHGIKPLVRVVRVGEPRLAAHAAVRGGRRRGGRRADRVERGTGIGARFAHDRRRARRGHHSGVRRRDGRAGAARRAVRLRLPRVLARRGVDAGRLSGPPVATAFGRLVPSAGSPMRGVAAWP